MEWLCRVSKWSEEKTGNSGESLTAAPPEETDHGHSFLTNKQKSELTATKLLSRVSFDTELKSMKLFVYVLRVGFVKCHQKRRQGEFTSRL